MTCFGAALSNCSARVCLALLLQVWAVLQGSCLDTLFSFCHLHLLSVLVVSQINMLGFVQDQLKPWPVCAMAASQSEERVLILPSFASHWSVSETQSC